MRRNPERVAWTVLSIAFILFWVFAIGTPVSIWSYLVNARKPQEALGQVVGGTVLVKKAKAGDPIGVTKDVTLAQGDEMITDATSSATIDLFDRSHVIVYSNTDLTLETMESPRFRPSNRPNEIVLNLTGGFVRVGVALPNERPTTFTVVTPHTAVSLNEGSYRIEVANDGTQVTVVWGQALVGQGSSLMALLQGTRSRVDLSGIPSKPVPVVRNVIENGNFQEPLSTGWLTSTAVLVPTVKPPQVRLVQEGGRQAVRFLRREEDRGNHTEAAIEQRLDYDVRDFWRLEVLLDVKLNYQSLSGGGQLSSEFPVIVRLDYKDLWGNDKFWTHGFYYQNQDGYAIVLDLWGKPTGDLIPRDVWYPYESGNLMELLGDNKPAHLTKLTVYASGWNYDSMVSEVQVLVE